jgi:hypothetical protein
MIEVQDNCGLSMSATVGTKSWRWAASSFAAGRAGAAGCTTLVGEADSAGARGTEDCPSAAPERPIIISPPDKMATNAFWVTKTSSVESHQPNGCAIATNVKNAARFRRWRQTSQ